MKCLLLLVCIGVVAAAPPLAGVEPILTDYHELIGIPEAARIKAAEEARDFDGARIVGGQLSALDAHPHIIGVTSFVAERGCQIGLPAGYARVTSFASWINARI